MRKYLIIVAAVLLYFPWVSGITIQNYTADITIEGFTLKETVTLDIMTSELVEPIEEFTYPVSGVVENLKVFGNGRPLNSKSEFRSGSTYITAFLIDPIGEDEEFTLQYSYDVPRQIDTAGGISILRTAHSLLVNVKNFEQTVILPEGSVILKDGYSPLGDIRSDGRHVVVHWKLNDPIPPEFRTFRIIILYESVTPIPPEPQDFTSFIPWGLSLVFGLAFVWMVYQNRKRPIIKRIPPNGEPDISSLKNRIEILKEDEQKIMEIIIENDGIVQTEIAKITDFSKTKVSKILTELEGRDLVRKEQIGRKNKVFITEKVKETTPPRLENI